MYLRVGAGKPTLRKQLTIDKVEGKSLTQSSFAAPASCRANELRSQAKKELSMLRRPSWGYLRTM